MGRSVPRRSNSSEEWASAELSTFHKSRSLVRRSTEGGGDGGSGQRRRNSSLSPISSTNGSHHNYNSKLNYVRNYTSKRAHHHHHHHGIDRQRRTLVRSYHEQDQDDELFLAPRRSLSESPLRFSSSSSSSSPGLLDHGFSTNHRCNESRLGLISCALFDMVLALVLSLCSGKKPICLRDLWNSSRCGGGGGKLGSSRKKEERRMQLVTVSMLGSMDWVRVVLRCDASVRATIQAVLKAFASQQRLPPNGSDPEAYDLHYSAFSLQCLDADELVENLGARNFVLCPKSFITPQQDKILP